MRQLDALRPKLSAPARNWQEGCLENNFRSTIRSQRKATTIPSSGNAS